MTLSSSRLQMHFHRFFVYEKRTDPAADYLVTFTLSSRIWLCLAGFSLSLQECQGRTKAEGSPILKWLDWRFNIGQNLDQNSILTFWAKIVFERMSGVWTKTVTRIMLMLCRDRHSVESTRLFDKHWSEVDIGSHDESLWWSKPVWKSDLDCGYEDRLFFKNSSNNREKPCLGTTSCVLKLLASENHHRAGIFAYMMRSLLPSHFLPFYAFVCPFYLMMFTSHLYHLLYIIGTWTFLSD